MRVNNRTVGAIVEQHDLPYGLVSAMIYVESGWRADVMRYEPGYRWLWDVKSNKPYRVSSSFATSSRAPDDFKGLWPESDDTEWQLQRFSAGPLQIMGATARELGYVRPLSNLNSWADGVVYACRHLAKLKRRFHEKHGWTGVCAAYNAGIPRYRDDGKFVNQSYVDKVRDMGGPV